jgi:hypothetical protein
LRAWIASEPREQLEAHESRESKANFALGVTIDVVLIHGYLGAAAQHAFDHGRHFRRRAALELRVDAAGRLVDVSGGHDPRPAHAQQQALPERAPLQYLPEGEALEGSVKPMRESASSRMSSRLVIGQR